VLARSNKSGLGEQAQGPQLATDIYAFKLTALRINLCRFLPFESKFHFEAQKRRKILEVGEPSAVMDFNNGLLE
jgi:hypothetical protein